MDKPVKLTNKLKVLLAIKNMQHNDFAKFMGKSANTVSNWINGRSNPTLEEAYWIAKYFGVPVTDVWMDEEPLPEVDMKRFLDLDKALDDYFKKG